MDGDLLTNVALVVFTLGYVLGRTVLRVRTRLLAPLSLTGLGLTGIVSMAATGESAVIPWIMFIGITVLGLVILTVVMRRSRRPTLV